MEIDWGESPVNAMYARFVRSGVVWYKKEFGQWYRWFGDSGWERSFSWDDELRNGEVFVRPEFEALADERLRYHDYIEKPTLTLQQLRSLVQESGLQIEFHVDGTIYVWDDTHEEGTRVNSLDEYVRLAEAKAAYAKLWSDYVWE